MKKRLIGAFIILLILIISLTNKTIFSLITLLASIFALTELIKAKYKDEKLDNIIYFICIISISLIVTNHFLFTVNHVITYIIPILLLSILLVTYNNKKYNVSDYFYLLAIIMFLGITFNLFIEIYNDNIYKCIYIFIVAFMTDTYAYISGMLIGKHKLTNISPNKTIEGSIVGTIIGCVISSLYYYIFIGNLSIIYIIIISLFLTILSEVGDLFFSSIKRYFKIKDYSNLIPGHGGILDRFDSVIFVILGLSLILNIL